MTAVSDRKTDDHQVRLRWTEPDFLRSMAFLGVVAQHILGAWARRTGVGQRSMLFISVCFELVRFAVPMFVFLFGMMLAQRLQAVTVMKGARSLVCCPDGTVYENSTGNAGMATGGSGDVLTGMTASFAGQLAAQGAEPAEAAKLGALCGVYVHGLAGDLAAKQWGQAGLMASDLADFAAIALQSFDKFRGTD